MPRTMKAARTAAVIDAVSGTHLLTHTEGRRAAPPWTATVERFTGLRAGAPMEGGDTRVGQELGAALAADG